VILNLKINRRLGDGDLTAAYEEQQKKGGGFEEISDDTLIAIDPRVIPKHYSKTLECLSKVPDSSADHRIQPGYSLLGYPPLDHVIPLRNS
jgi:hypothetical protein